MKPNHRLRPSFPLFSPRGALAALVVALVAVAVARLMFSTAAPPPTAEARAHDIGERLACPICQGLSVADSPSALAGQMRAVIVEQIKEGRSDAQIEQYFVARYGQAILLTPPKSGFTLLAWWVPLVVFVVSGGGLGLAAYRWSRRPAADDALPRLTAEEQRRYTERLAAELAAGDDLPATETAARAEMLGEGEKKAADAGVSAEMGARR